ncbi:hypothetical protein BOX15_Mlig000010g2, partial [Macrostomum lignano]
EFSLNPALSSPEFIADFSSHYSAAANYSDPGGAFDLYGKPFVCARLRRLLASESALTSVASAAERLAYTRRSSDLHQLAQSGDLADAATRAPKILRQFRSFLLDSVRPWLQRLIGLQLSDAEIDVTCSRYGRGDCLLCHDDRMLGRRVAFVWYLVDSGWSDSDGGALELLGRSLAMADRLNRWQPRCCLSVTLSCSLRCPDSPTIRWPRSPASTRCGSPCTAGSAFLGATLPPLPWLPRTPTPRKRPPARLHTWKRPWP